MKSLETLRLALEPVTATNAKSMWQLLQAGGLRKYQDVPRYSRDEFVTRVEQRPATFSARSSGRFEWILRRRSDGESLGWLSLRVGEGARGSAEIGYTLLVAHRGRGYAREAVARIVDFGFRDGGLQRIEACCVPENVASRSLLDAVGFSFGKLQRRGAVVRGRAVDILLFAVERAAWSAQGSSANSIDISASANS